MNFSTNRYIPIFCDKSLRWFGKTYDFIDLRKWEDFDKNRDQYIENAQKVTFDEIYRSIGFRVINNSLKLFKKFTPEELAEFKPKNFVLINSELIKMPEPEKYKAVAACLRCPRNDLYVTRRVVNDHFRYLKNE